MIMMMSPRFCSAFLVCAAARRSACNVLKFNGQRIRWVFVSHALTWQVPWMLDPTKQLELVTVDTGHPQKTDLHDRGELCFKVEQSWGTYRLDLACLPKSSVHWHGDVFLASLALQLGVVLFFARSTWIGIEPYTIQKEDENSSEL